MREYDEVTQITKDAAMEAFASDDIERVCKALVSVAFHETDWRWAQERCLEFLANENENVSGLAATCLGHIARIRGMVDKPRVIAALRARLRDPRIAGQVEDALHDIEMFA
jgi:hypothetical protein